MTISSLQVLYSAEYFLRRQLVGEDTTGPNGYGYNNGSNGSGNDYYMDTAARDISLNPNSSDNDILYATSSPPLQVIDNDGSGSSSASSSSGNNSQGRTVLTILYLCVLGLCFIIPIIYYFRLHCFEEYARRREMELDFTTALEQSTDQDHRDEARAARRKYIDERRARIVQLFGPVRMVRSIFISFTDTNSI